MYEGSNPSTTTKNLQKKMLPEQKQEILKFLRREILKSAKRGDTFYYWDISELNKVLVDIIIAELEKEGKIVKSKGANFKIIRW